MTRILVVDDHAANREFLVTLLGYRGYEVLEAVDGADALDRTRRERPDLVIADILMPTMDGYEFVRQLRDDPDIADTPVIFCTAVYHERETRELAESCGVSHVLTKPCEPEVVLQTVEAALEATPERPAVPDKEEFDREHLRVMTDKLSRTVDDLGVANQRFAALTDINLQLASERDPGVLLDGVCPAARELVGAKYAVLAAGKRTGPDVLHTVTAGMEPATTNAFEYGPLDQGQIGIAYTERRPLRLLNPNGNASVLGLPTGHPPVQSVMVAPIMSLKHVYGWICLSDRIGSREFSDEDERLLSILAAQVGRIYENGDLYFEVQQSEGKFRQIAEHIHEVFFLVDPALTRMDYVSPAYENVWGRDVESLYENPRGWIDAVHPEDVAHVKATFSETRTTGRFDFEYRIVRPDGDTRWIHTRGVPVRDAQGNTYRIAGIAEDITERKQAEERIKRLNRVYAVLRGINGAIVRIRDRQTLFDETSRILVEHGGFEMAWVGILDHDTRFVAPAAWQGPEPDRDFIFGLKVSADGQIPEGRTTIGRAIRGRRPVVSNDLKLEEDHPIFTELMRRGYRSVSSLPLASEDTCVGVIALSSKAPNMFDSDEMKLLTELAGDVSFALDYMRNEKRVAHLAFHDALTGLPNRTMLHQHLRQVIDETRQQHRPFALLLLNINNFQDINHTLGHHNGDLLLREVARRLGTALWQSDVVACLGGDEFAILLPHLRDKRDIDLVVRKVSNALRKQFVLENVPVNVEARLGISLCPDHGNTADLLWRHADIALRAAKDLHQTWTYYDPENDRYDPDRLALLGGLRTAMDHNELVLHYQPRIDLRTGHTQGVEALLRWQHPERGLLYPDAFIPFVERTGLIDGLTTWVMANALRQGYLWHRNGLRLDVAVNLSVRNLQQPNLTTGILELARSSMFPLELLTLEITETAVMVDPVHARIVLQELSDAGIRLSLDDFGTGQSSLAYVRELPISSIKIDKSFLMDFDQPGNAAIVRTAIELAHYLGLSVIAEGVEDESTCAVLRELGCDAAQGYLFSKPLPVDELTAWMHDSKWKYQQ